MENKIQTNEKESCIDTIEELRDLESRITRSDYKDGKTIPLKTTLFKNCENVWEIYTLKKGKSELIFRKANQHNYTLSLWFPSDFNSRAGLEGFFRFYTDNTSCVYDSNHPDNMIIRDTPYINDYKTETLIPQKHKEKICSFKREDIKNKKPEYLGLERDEFEILRIILDTTEDKGKRIKIGKHIKGENENEK